MLPFGSVSHTTPSVASPFRDSLDIGDMRQEKESNDNSGSGSSTVVNVGMV